MLCTTRLPAIWVILVSNQKSSLCYTCIITPKRVRKEWRGPSPQLSTWSAPRKGKNGGEPLVTLSPI